jgi:undecaprenyl-diphosphatase
VELFGGFCRFLVHRRGEDSQERLIIYIILSTIPAAVAGFLLEKMIEGSFRKPALIVLPLVAVSFLMIYAERRPHPSHPLDALRLKDALIIGCAQALAFLPGVSRSGITITTGLLRGYGREAATRFSFLLSTPAIAGAALLHLGHLPRNMVSEWPVFAIGFASSGIVGYLAIAFLIHFLRRHTLNAFAGYRLAVAGIIIFWIFWRG